MEETKGREHKGTQSFAHAIPLPLVSLVLVMHPLHTVIVSARSRRFPPGTMRSGTSFTSGPSSRPPLRLVVSCSGPSLPSPLSSPLPSPLSSPPLADDAALRTVTPFGGGGGGRVGLDMSERTARFGEGEGRNKRGKRERWGGREKAHAYVHVCAHPHTGTHTGTHNHTKQKTCVLRCGWTLASFSDAMSTSCCVSFSSNSAEDNEKNKAGTEKGD